MDHYIEAMTLDRLHFLAVRACLMHGDTYVIDRGSFEGQTRYELPFATLQVTKPGIRPLAPQMVAGVPPPTTDEEIEKYYYENLMNEDPRSYDYTYGQFIVPQLPEVIKMLADTPMTNQACINVGDVASIHTKDPPCLRVMDFRRTKDNILNMYLYFRSWDCWGGLPQNLGGLQLLKEDIAMAIGAADGRIIAMSKGLHLYDHHLGVVKDRFGIDR